MLVTIIILIVLFKKYIVGIKEIYNCSLRVIIYIEIITIKNGAPNHNYFAK